MSERLKRTTQTTGAGEEAEKRNYRMLLVGTQADADTVFLKKFKKKIVLLYDPAMPPLVIFPKE